MAEAQHDYRVAMLLLLSVVTGVVDAVSVLGLDHAFVANMTGNVVFLGFAAARAPGFHPIPLAASIVAFVIGAAAGGKLARAHADRTERRWLLTVGILEVCLLLSAALVAYAVATPPVEFLLVPLALAMGLRNASVRKLGVADLTTTVLTLTLTGVGADSRIAGGPSTNWMRRLGAVAAIGCGAAFGALLLSRTGLVPPLLCAALLTAGAATLPLFSSASMRVGKPT